MVKKTLILAALAATLSAHAQVVLTGSTYYQDFNTLPSTGTSLPWVNNLPASGMAGWYSTETTFSADDGNSVLNGQYSYGSTGSGERALGSIALPGAIIFYGMQLNNGSGGTFASLYVDYTGEQWRSGAALTDVLLFEYSTNATSLLSGNWTAVPALDFNSPTNTGAFALNGNLPANQSFQSATITGLNWLNGTDVWVRWAHIGNASRHGMAIDDVHVSAAPVPEPASLAILGVALLGLRRSRARK